MSIENNNRSIRIRLTCKGQKLTLTGLGSFDDEKALRKADELEAQIKRDLKAGLVIKDSTHLREILSLFWHSRQMRTNLG